MSVAGAAIRRGRVQAERLMLTEGIIRRATGAMTTDPVTLEEVPVMATIYAGKCKTRMPGATSPGTSQIPGQSIVKDESILSLPIGAPGSGDVRTNDVWECTANPLDPSLVGVKLRIAGVHHQTFATAHRFPVEEVS